MDLFNNQKMKTIKFDIFKTKRLENSQAIEFANIGFGQTTDNVISDEMTFQQWIDFINYTISVINESIENKEVKTFN